MQSAPSEPASDQSAPASAQGDVCSLPVSAVVPNWNGAPLLQRYLPGLLAEIRRHHAESECIVVDDGSSDNSIAILRENLPDARIVARTQNSGFSSAVNDGIRAARHEHVLILNNDVEVTPGFIDKLFFTFLQTPETFAVAALQKQRLPDGQVLLDGVNVFRWREGHLTTLNVTEKVIQGHHDRMGYCSAGCSLFSRAKLLKLGGFCEAFDPFYYEDAEIGMQAAKNGWHLAFASDSIVFHYHGQTARAKPWQLRFLPVRNFFLLNWFALDSATLWWSHIAHVAARLIWWTLTGRIRYTVGLILALLKLPEVIPSRRRRCKHGRYSLQEILRRK